jgi:hypothetical protein
MPPVLGALSRLARPRRRGPGVVNAPGCGVRAAPPAPGVAARRARARALPGRGVSNVKHRRRMAAAAEALWGLSATARRRLLAAVVACPAAACRAANACMAGSASSRGRACTHAGCASAAAVSWRKSHVATRSRAHGGARTGMRRAPPLGSARGLSRLSARAEKLKPAPRMRRASGSLPCAAAPSDARSRPGPRACPGPPRPSPDATKCSGADSGSGARSLRLRAVLLAGEQPASAHLPARGARRGVLRRAHRTATLVRNALAAAHCGGGAARRAGMRWRETRARTRPPQLSVPRWRTPAARAF